ncbi:MAG: bacteriophage abortive infection AbiH family protein [Prevotella sp.]|nr:bacteriophage abortive infection AbiH family protein [Prevotella sp.]
MKTRYGDFKRWLIDNGRVDVIQELQSAYPSQKGNEYLLWSDFETALGEYDLDTVINWSWENLYLNVDSVGNMLFNNGFIDTQLPDIISEAFTKWVCGIRMLSPKVFDNITSESLYLTFNYTDTLETLYQIPEWQVLHIHGRASKGEKLIVGHNHHINPADYWDDNIDLRENNERIQRLTDMNDLCKPYYDIIERNEIFFQSMNSISDIYVIGHSCDEIDYPYFRKVRESVSSNARWHYNPYSEDDERRIDVLKQK